MPNKNQWKRGIAFIKGINMFDNARITKKKMKKLCKKIENENMEIENIYRTDNILFKKKNIHYATVGQKIEKILSEHFDKKIHVTCRSRRTVKNLIQKEK